MKNLTVLAALFAVGCVDIKEDTGTDTTDTADTEVVVADPTFQSQGRQRCIFEHH